MNSRWAARWRRRRSPPALSLPMTTNGMPVSFRRPSYNGGRGRKGSAGAVVGTVEVDGAAGVGAGRLAPFLLAWRRLLALFGDVAGDVELGRGFVGGGFGGAALVDGRPAAVLGHARSPSPRSTRGPGSGSDFDLAAHLDHPVGGEAEEFHRAFRVAHHPGEQLLAPQRHAANVLGGERGLAGEEEARVHHLKRQA